MGNGASRPVGHGLDIFLTEDNVVVVNKSERNGV